MMEIHHSKLDALSAASMGMSTSPRGLTPIGFLLNPIASRCYEADNFDQRRAAVSLPPLDLHRIHTASPDFLPKVNFDHVNAFYAEREQQMRVMATRMLSSTTHLPFQLPSPTSALGKRLFSEYVDNTPPLTPSPRSPSSYSSSPSPPLLSPREFFHTDVPSPTTAFTLPATVASTILGKPASKPTSSGSSSESGGSPRPRKRVNKKKLKCELVIERKYLRMKQSDAAFHLGFSPSTFSKRWRNSLPDRKWPFRKHFKLHNSVKDLKALQKRGFDVDKDLSVLLREKEENLEAAIVHYCSKDILVRQRATVEQADLPDSDED